MPENQPREQAINIFRSNSVKINGAELADAIKEQMERDQVRGSIHSLIDLDTNSQNTNRSQNSQNTLPKPRPHYSTQPLGELMRLSEERNKTLRNLQR